MPIIPTLGKQSWENKKFSVTLGYIINLRSAYLEYVKKEKNLETEKAHENQSRCDAATSQGILGITEGRKKNEFFLQQGQSSINTFVSATGAPGDQVSLILGYELW